MNKLIRPKGKFVPHPHNTYVYIYCANCGIDFAWDIESDYFPVFCSGKCWYEFGTK